MAVGGTGVTVTDGAVGIAVTVGFGVGVGRRAAMTGLRSSEIAAMMATTPNGVDLINVRRFMFASFSLVGVDDAGVRPRSRLLLRLPV